MYSLILLLPLVSSISSGLFGRFIGSTGSHIISILCLSISTLITCVGIYDICIGGSPVTISIFSWLDSGYINFDWSFTFDQLTISRLLPVLFVSTRVHIYSVDYMSHDPHNQRFFSYLSRFTLFRLILVTGDNYPILFLGWEGIGVSSYLLISFWYTRIDANKAARQAMIINRVGDMFFSLGLFLSIWVFMSLDFNVLLSLSENVNPIFTTLLCILLISAAMGKSAQIGLHTWLPSAMEGPTPVSALIHAATLVTAGIYLLMRSSPLLEMSSTALLLITWVGAITSLFAATTGMVQNDRKRVIAYSTCSQMGYLFMSLGMSQYSLALFHLINHAFFKALLFLAAGGVLHSIYDQQDMRRMGGLSNLMPFTYVCILIGSLSLMAVPFMSGFYSKDMIIEIGMGSYNLNGSIVYWIGTLTAAITSYYSMRLIGLVFLSKPNNNVKTYEDIHEQSFIVAIPLITLAIRSIVFGYMFKDAYIGLGSDFLGNSVASTFNHAIIETEFNVPTGYKLLPMVGLIIGAISTIIYSETVTITNIIRNSNLTRNIYKFFINKWRIDTLINGFNNHYIDKSKFISSSVDIGALELIGPKGTTFGVINTSSKLNIFNTGVVMDYSMFTILWMTIILILVSI